MQSFVPFADSGMAGMAGIACVAWGTLHRIARRHQKVRAGGRSRIRQRCQLKDAMQLQEAWLFDAALVMVEDLKEPRAKALKAASLVGLGRFSEAREIIDEINWTDILVAAETGIDRTEFLQRCEILERQNGLKDSSEAKQNSDDHADPGRFLFPEIFAPMLRARESGRDPATPLSPTAALLPPVSWQSMQALDPSIKICQAMNVKSFHHQTKACCSCCFSTAKVPEAAGDVEVRSTTAGRGLFATSDVMASSVVLCGLPLARCVNTASGEPLVPALRQAAE